MTAEGVAFEKPPEPHPVRLAGTLGLAGLLSGLLLVIAYEVTLPRIEANRAAALRKAVFEVVPGAVAMQKLVWSGGALKVADGSEAKGAPAIYAAYGEDGGFRGYAIPGEASGFQDVIKLIYGYVPDRERIVGMRVLESRETPGLGDKIFKDDDFIANFDDLAVAPSIVAVPKGTKDAPYEIDAITGATISSKAVVRILNQTNEEWLGRLPPPGGEPALQKEEER